MAFEQIKAKLGLDITNFQRGIAASQKDLGKFQENARGILMNFFAPAAILTGINSVIVKAQELRDKAIEAGQAFSDSVRQTAEMGDNINRAKGFLFELASKGLAAYQSRIENVTAATIALFNPKLTREQILKDLQEQKKLDAQARVAGKDSAKREKDRADQEKKDIEAIEKSFKAAADEREKQKFKELSIDGKIASKQADLAKAQKAANDETKGGVQRAEAVAKAQQLQSDIKDLQVEKTEAAADAEKRLEDAVSGVVNMLVEASAAEKARTDELAKQTAELKKQGRATEDNMKAQRRQAELPTMADVISGKRNIGSVGKNRATKLERDREKAARLSDAEQRAREAFSGATTESARAAALENGRRIRAQLDATRGQIANAEDLLTTRVADANPYAAMEKELGEIKGQLKTLNETTLAPTKIK